MVVDDARILDPGGCQIETYYKRQRSFTESEFGFLPACNPWGNAELSLGGTWLKSALPGDSRVGAAQAKGVLKPLEPNGAGFGVLAGIARAAPFNAPRATNPYGSLIASISLLDDKVVAHGNLGLARDRQANLTRGTWGAAAEVPLDDRFMGIVETYGQRGEKPTLHGGVRITLVPNRLQADASLGLQHASPERRFNTVGLRFLW